MPCQTGHHHRAVRWKLLLPGKLPEHLRQHVPGLQPRCVEPGHAGSSAAEPQVACALPRCGRLLLLLLLPPGLPRRKRPASETLAAQRPASALRRATGLAARAAAAAAGTVPKLSLPALAAPLQGHVANGSSAERCLAAQPP